MNYTFAFQPILTRLARLGMALSLLLGLLGGAPAMVVQAAPGSEAPAVESAAATARPQADWLAAVQQDIQRSEYQVTWSEQTNLADLPAAYQAPNRANNLRTYFSESGPRLAPRQVEAGQAPAWELGMRLNAYGREGALQAVGKALHSAAQDERFSYQYANIEEWYLNRTEGVEQGFTLSERPTGSGQLALEIGLSGNLTPHLLEEEQAIEFTTSSGVTVLRYDRLHAIDATGKELEAELTLTQDESILLLINDTGAQYPLTIDPLAATPNWMAESNQTDAYYSSAVGTAGDVNGDGYADVIVGAGWYDNGLVSEGAVFVYHGSASGLSVAPLTANWTMEINQSGALFGWSAATAGDVNGDGYSDVIVGAYDYHNGQDTEGAAFVYYGSASGLSTTANWTMEINQAGANFGWSVATAGDVNGDGYSDVIVGAPHYANGQSAEGGAFVYHGSASGLGASAAWITESDQVSALFGWSVATAGDVNGDGYSDVIVGAYQYDNGQTTEGVAYLYYGSSTGLDLGVDWTAEGNQDWAYFGVSVSTAGDVNGDGYADVIVGAFGYSNGQTNEGVAFVYHGSASGPSTTPNSTLENDQASARFGWSVSTAGDVNGDGYSDVIVGAVYYGNGQTNEGGAFVYSGSASGLSSTPAWSAESDQASAQFGDAVGTAGDVNGDGYADVIVGARWYDNGETNEGRAYVYQGAASGLSDTAAWVTSGGQFDANFGHSVDTAGDVNGDGYADVIIGAGYYDNGEDAEGRAYVYLGSASGLSTTPTWVTEGNQAGVLYGNSVGTAGDVNGDGYSDAIVSAYRYTNGQTEEGRAYVYLGSASGLSTTPAWMAEGDQNSANFGYSVGTAGDVNGDGFADIIVGAPRYAGGRTYVYYGSAAGPSVTADWTGQAGYLFGWSVGTAGDVNGDGFADVIIGATGCNSGQTEEGCAYVYHGSASGLGASPNWTAESNQANANFGWSVGAAGDVNGDGYADVIVGAVMYDNGEAEEGAAFAYYGSASGLSGATLADADWSTEGNQANSRYGWSVGTAGDVNGDGYAEAIVGAYFYASGQTMEGHAFLYHGSASGLSASADWSAEGNQDNALFGDSVGTAGDVNGDGYADVIVGSSWYNNGILAEGAAFVYYGNGGDGLDLRPQARLSDNSAPIQPLGLSDSGSAFRLAALGRTPFGRSKVKLEWEAKPMGTPFDGTGLSMGIAWTDTYTTGVALNELVSVLASQPSYHWRLRLRYHPASTPFQQYSRWVTQPWNGWNESDLRLLFYTLTMHKVGNGAVSPEVGSTDYPEDTVVPVGATADPGWTFAGWSGDLSGNTNPTTITMDTNKEVTATFTQNEYTLTVNTVSNGTVTKNPDQATYHYGDVVTITATTDPGWSFTGWSGSLSGTTNPATLTIDDNKSVTATFTMDHYTLNVAILGSGTVSKNPDQPAYTYGHVVTLTATADPGWTFAGWSGDLSDTANPTTITMNSSKAVTATFTQDEYTLGVTLVGSGTVTKNPNQTSYHYGDVVTLTATADAHWTFAGWSGDLSGTATPIQITMNGNKAVSATFTQDAYTLNVTVVGSGTVTKNPNQDTYHYGDVVTLTANPAAGWTFTGWSGDLNGVASLTANPIQITMDGNKTVTATFAGQYRIYLPIVKTPTSAVTWINPLLALLQKVYAP